MIEVEVSLTPMVGTLYVAAEAILLGFQHFVVMLGTTVIIPSALVPQMGGGNVSLETLPRSLFFWFR
jgi:xanthine/uracil permease